MATPLSTVERAFQLARSGNCKSVRDIRTALAAERYDAVGSHLDGPLIKRQLRAAIIAADC